MAQVKRGKEPAYLKPLLKRIKTVHNTHEHSDLVIKCEGREWQVHKLIVCSQSDPIDAAVRNFQEGEDGVYTMDKQDPQVVGALIHYLYNFDYGDEEGPQSDVAALVLDVRMSIIADEYLVAPLGTLAAEKFEERCAKDWASADFAKAVSELYENGSDANKLKTVAIGTIKLHATEIFDDERETEFSALFQILRNTELGVDVSRALAASLSVVEKTYKCPSTCKGRFTARISGNCLVNCPKGCHKKGASVIFWSQNLVKDGK